MAMRRVMEEIDILLPILDSLTYIIVPSCSVIIAERDLCPLFK